MMMGRAGSGCLSASTGGRDLLSTVLMLADLHSGLLREAETQQPPDPFGTSLRGPAFSWSCLLGGRDFRIPGIWHKAAAVTDCATPVPLPSVPLAPPLLMSAWQFSCS